MGVLDQLLSKGYFPKELPPAFTTEKFARAVTQTSFTPDNCLVAPKADGTPVHESSIICGISGNW